MHGKVILKDKSLVFWQRLPWPGRQESWKAALLAMPRPDVCQSRLFELNWQTRELARAVQSSAKLSVA